MPLRTGSFDEWWSRTSSLAGPLTNLLAALPEAAANALQGRLREAVRGYATPRGYEFPGLALLAVGGR